MVKIFLAITLLALPSLAENWHAPESLPERLFPYQGTKLPPSHAGNGEKPRVGLYVGKGAWSTGVEHLKMFLTEHGFSYRSFTPEAILADELDSSGVRALIMPGGESWEYLASLGEKGAQRIRNFVERGGGYVGICAGAFYAISRRMGGHTTGPYGIGLLDGTAYDGTALGTPPFAEGMMDIPLLPHGLGAGMGNMLRIVMFGGPSFRYSPEEATQKKIQIVAEFPEIREPAMVLFRYGTGRVFLSGPHLEIEEDRTDWGPEYDDPESDWPLLESAVLFIEGIGTIDRLEPRRH